MQDAQTAILVLLFAVTLVFACLGLMLLFVWVFSPWFLAHLSGVPISVLRILGMRIRRTDVGAVLRALIRARQAGLDVSCAEMEQAYRQGVDLESLTSAAIERHRRDADVDWQQLVNDARQGRLASGGGSAAEP
jgi:uncharacterized protein YqfA (UPF0365 family)